MKNKFKIIITGIIINLAAFFVLQAPASATNQPLFFRSVNAGYKDDNSAQNYDFFELAKDTESDLFLSDYRVEYYNSSDKLSGEIVFDDDTILHAKRAVFGFSKSPQYLDSSARYLYGFGSSGLASTAGRLLLKLGDETVDELCWGKITCTHQVEKFATSKDDNYSAVRCRADNCETDYIQEKYYPAIDESAIIEAAPVQEPITSCKGLIITELYAYYEESQSEQFVELYNALDEDIVMDGCVLRYKNKDYVLDGAILSNQYIVYKDIQLTKNPSSIQTIELVDTTGDTIDAVSYDHGQKKGTSVALFGDQ